MDHTATYKYKYYKYKTKYINMVHKLAQQQGGAKNKHKHNIDHILGALYGACVGDALGSRYEFLSSIRSIEKLDEDLTQEGYLPMLGEGPFNNLPGQISDDSEMMLSMLKSIFYKKTYDQEDVAQQYIRWFNTNPIDVGKTIKRALFTREPSNSNRDMVNNSRELNNSSMSNGVLMRAQPLGVLGLKIPDGDLKLAVQQECDLTHPNKVVKDAVYIYTLAIKYTLLKMPIKKIYNKLLKSSSEQRVRQVIKDSRTKPEPTNMDPKGSRYINADSKWYQGYFGIALQQALYELFHGSSFEGSLINIIKRGGDVDTNCAIAGGLLGAYYGLSNIDHRWVDSVKELNPRTNEYPFLSPRVIDGYIHKMFKKGGKQSNH